MFGASNIRTCILLNVNLPHSEVCCNNNLCFVSLQVLGRCFLTVMQVHFQFLSQALQKVQPVAQSCLAEALAQAQERCTNARSQSSDLGPLTELEDASRSWKGAAEVCSHEAPPDSSWSGVLEIWGLSV